MYVYIYITRDPNTPNHHHHARVKQGKCLHCNAPGQQATLRMLLNQADDGLNFAQGAPGAVRKVLWVDCVRMGLT
jgi:hypothetical protein